MNSLAWLPTRIMGMGGDLEMMGHIIKQNKGITRSMKKIDSELRSMSTSNVCHQDKK